MAELLKLKCGETLLIGGRNRECRPVDASFAKISVSASRTSGRSFTEMRNKSGPITEPCGTQLCIGVSPECSPPTCTLETRPEGYALIHSTTTSLRQKGLIYLLPPPRFEFLFTLGRVLASFSNIFKGIWRNRGDSSTSVKSAAFCWAKCR